MFKSEFLRVLDERGFIYQGANLEQMDEACAKDPITGYFGTDATAESLHVGHLTVLMMAYWLQQTGNNFLMLIGGGTTRIGDPSGRDEQRQLLSDAKIAQNAVGIQKSIEKVIRFDGPRAACLVNNADWLDDLLYIPFLREIGVHFSINRMITLESNRLRLDREQPLSFIEFNYVLLQSYDFLELFRKHNCVLQFGGGDQWGNIVSGVDLVRRVTGQEVYGLTCPLLQTASGKKMGKTAAGAVWLNAEMYAPYDYWQFWRNVEDADVERFLKLYTTLPMDEIARLSALSGSELNAAKIALADHATALIHGKDVLADIHKTVASVFGASGASGDVAALPEVRISRVRLEEGVSVVEIIEQLGFAGSRTEGRQFIHGGAVSIDGALVSDPFARLTMRDFDEREMLRVSVGKKRHGIVRKEE